MIQEQHIRRLWRERVHGRFIYRGMSAKDLVDPLEPARDPFDEVRPDLDALLALLERLLGAGFAFTVHEDYSGLSFDLRDIVAWTRRDLAEPGLDFTSSLESACGYAQNHEGSQLRQNFRYITAHLPARRDEPLVRRLTCGADWTRAARLYDWMARASPDHERVVVWVRRSCPAFDGSGSPFVGSFECFRERLPNGTTLPDEPGEFCVCLALPLPLSQVECVQTLAFSEGTPCR
jgi:hypothetical protein